MDSAEPRSEVFEKHGAGDLNGSPAAAVSAPVSASVSSTEGGDAPKTEVAQVDAPKKRREKKGLDADALEASVRAGDEDRWLASRFAPKGTREHLMALYAFNLEIASIANKVTDPRLGEMRLQFWRDTTEAIFRGGTPPDHPVARALAKVVEECRPPLAEFDALLTARAQDLNAAPFEQWSDLDSYIDGVTGAVTRLAVLICAPDMEMTKQKQTAISAVSRAWGYIGLLRALPEWMANGRTFYPAALRENLGISGRVAHGEQDEAFFAFAAHAVLDRAVGAQKSVARYEKVFPREAFPAVGYAALAPLYLRNEAERSLGRAPKVPSLLRRQWKLVLAAGTGAL